MDSDIPVEEYCKINKCNIFLELGTFEKTSDVIDVILQDKVRQLCIIAMHAWCQCHAKAFLCNYSIFQKAKGQLYYTGPTARKMVKDHYKRGGTEGFDRDKWRVFVLCKIYDKGIVLKSGTNILQYKARYS